MFTSLYTDVHAMNHPNLARRGHLFWWRRKITIGGIKIAIDLPLRTADLYLARAIASRLGVKLEECRMAYGERGTTVDPATLKRVFQDAMRWQLDRIRRSQIGSTEGADAHRRTNRNYAELWRHHASRGADAPWTGEDESRLISEGWSSSEVRELMVEANRHGNRLVSVHHLQTYAEHFGFELTPSNHKRVEQVVLSARAAACERASESLGRIRGISAVGAKRHSHHRTRSFVKPRRVIARAGLRRKHPRQRSR